MFQWTRADRAYNKLSLPMKNLVVRGPGGQYFDRTKIDIIWTKNVRLLAIVYIYIFVLPIGTNINIRNALTQKQKITLHLQKTTNIIHNAHIYCTNRNWVSDNCKYTPIYHMYLVLTCILIYRRLPTILTTHLLHFQQIMEEITQ